MSIAQSLIMEFDREAETTRRVLSAIPAEKFSWKPHKKSYSIGQLATHMCQALETASAGAEKDVVEFSQGVAVEPRSSQELLAAFDQAAAKVRGTIGKMDDARLMATWTGTVQGRPILTIPRAGFIRMVVLNHHYHHRGQMTVYLRLLDVPVPHVYGPSADDNPFMNAAAAD